MRAYSYAGDCGETFFNEGETTTVEKPYNLIDTNSPEAESEEYFQREDIVYPDEDFVIKVAASWSVDPTELESHTEIPPIGLLGKIGE